MGVGATGVGKMNAISHTEMVKMKEKKRRGEGGSNLERICPYPGNVSITEECTLGYNVSITEDVLLVIMFPLLKMYSWL